MQPVIQLRSSRTTASSLLQLGKGRTQIGRGAGCGLRLQYQGVSRDHGAFTYCIGLLMVEDHDSTNGIFVNGVRVKRQVLYAGDRVTVGPIEIYIQKGSAAPSTATA